ncbi:hypothetical protein [Halorubrum sp. Atlit-26R]|uniref:hypothetical protein n=1 Tax=Halorubrum sp. Atlit-26R TaxID=2282128 RepID=UPI000EF21ADD|nr:hypothetical protein [Halorubrum sp. Atlit-26R]RLM68536.1 hypothetical protein DVK07_10465 [Halorubrum sp. Atlit-26R]
MSRAENRGAEKLFSALNFLTSVAPGTEVEFTIPGEQELAASRDGYRYGVRQVDRYQQPNHYVLTGAATEVDTVDPDERFESYHMAVTALAEAITTDERQDDLTPFEERDSTRTVSVPVSPSTE